MEINGKSFTDLFLIVLFNLDLNN